LNYAAERASSSNVIVLSASSHAVLEQTLEEYAWRFCQDIIRDWSTELFDAWKAQIPALRARSFLAWAGNENNNCIIIFDELDDIDDADTISKALPQAARVAISTRNPAISETLDLHFRCLNRPVFQLEAEEATSLITSMVASNFLICGDQLDRLSTALDRHPFAICAASSYLRTLGNAQDSLKDGSTVEVFLNILEGSSYEGRKAFFDSGRTWAISKLFTSAMTNLKKRSTGAAFDSTVRTLLQAIAFTSGSDQDCSFVRFFGSINSSWLKHIPEGNAIDNVFKQGLLKGNAPEMLVNLRQASLVVKLPSHTHMPLLWRDCVLLYECASTDERRYWLKQVLLLCYHHSRLHNWGYGLAPHVENCMRIATRYDIPTTSLLLHEDHKVWLDATLGLRTHAKALAKLLIECRKTEETRKCSSVHLRDMQSTYAGLAIRLRSLKSKLCAVAIDPEWERIMKEIDTIFGAVNPFYGTSLPERDGT
jgi:hypothetical protein